MTLDAAHATTYGLASGGMYSIDLFQAERHTCGSRPTSPTLSGFTHTISTCNSVCGDGIVAGNEQCDEGALNGTGYGHCNANCTLGPRCGDATVQNPPEKCDNGTNATTYGGASKVCGPGCQFAPYCGDGVTSNGESCDEGAANGSRLRPPCTAGCTLGPRCGDGVLQAANGEQCDDCVNNGSTGDKCMANCTLKCVDGVVSSPARSFADNGAANNTEAATANATPTVAPSAPLRRRCIKNGPEQCDDGKNDGTYGTCNPNCTLAGYCGDGNLAEPPETCDQGSANSATAYGKNLCTNHCTPAPYCGDKAVEGQFGETCDDGMNTGLPGSCTTDCKMFVPLATCGNGVLNTGEQCDDGANNGTAGDKCDVHCHFKCGNGIKDPGEQCDDGVNNGAYGTCNPNCTLPGYCGDGIKNGPEQCDNGASQPVASPPPTAQASAPPPAPSPPTAATAAPRRSSASSATDSPTATPGSPARTSAHGHHSVAAGRRRSPPRRRRTAPTSARIVRGVGIRGCKGRARLPGEIASRFPRRVGAKSDTPRLQ